MKFEVGTKVVVDNGSKGTISCFDEYSATPYQVCCATGAGYNYNWYSVEQIKPYVRTNKFPPFLNGDLVALKGEKDPVGHVSMTGIKNGYVTVSKIVTMYGESKFGDYAIEDLVLVPEVTQKQEVKPEGRKYDSGKPMYNLLPADALEEVVKVLTYGSVKYNEPAHEENWRKVEYPEQRYFAAMQRHVWATRKGEMNDPESGISHYAHAITSLMFLLQAQIEANKNANPT